MQDFWTIALWNLAAVSFMMVLGWVVSLVQRNVTIVDSLWGLGFIIIAWLSVSNTTGYTGRGLLLAVLTTIWGLRLTFHLVQRNWAQPEDPRYAVWRKASGNRFWLSSLIKVFLLQALFMWAIGLALQFGIASVEPGRFTWLDGIGLLLWCVGFAFETVADFQLARFKSDPSNAKRVMQQGLWALSRHPNYFGEVVLWWGIFVIVLATPGSGWTIISPLIISTVLLKMTGVPLTEKHIAKNRPGYDHYIATTNAFFPWFPKKRIKSNDQTAHGTGRSGSSA